jgi:parallel beta-helix repeat protein
MIYSRRVKTNNQFISIGIAYLLVIGGFFSFITFESEVVNAGTTIYVDDDNTLGPWDGSLANPYNIIQDAIDAASDGDTVYVFNGIYWSVVIDNKTINLVGEDRNNTIINGTGSGTAVFIMHTNWVNMTNFNVSGGSYGIKLINSSNNTIKDNIMLLHYSGINLYKSSDNRIINNIILNLLGSFNDRSGIELNWSHRNLILNNNCSFSFIGILVEWSSYNIIQNNICNNNFWDGIHIEDTSYWNKIIGNTASRNNKTGIFMGGLGQGEPNRNYITDNIVLNNNLDGIWIRWALENDIINNIFSSNSRFGIHLLWVKNINITSNIVTNNNVGGVRLHHSTDNNITVNTFSENNGSGIDIYSSSNNSITKNTVSLNMGYGFHLEASSNNSIYHNNIIDNNIQAFDDMDDNIWNDSYPSGGNYWSDFDEPSEGAYDNYIGPDQDVLGNDGIVDNGTIKGGGKNPYVIDLDSQDIYPLIIPVDTIPPIIKNLQPPDGSTTTDNTPIISADYADPSGIDLSSVLLMVNGIDVTSFAIVTAGGVSFLPGGPLSDGIYTVYIEVSDIYGNQATATWSFIVGTALPPPTNLTTKVVNNGQNVELEWDPPISFVLDHYLIYRAASVTEFDFSTPYNSSITWLDPKNTIWVDPDPSITTVDDDFYYIVRAANFDESDISSTSNTAGVWTRSFQSGISTYSLPLEPFEKENTEFYCQDMNASYIKWMNLTTHTWMQHDKGDSVNNTLLELGEGYEIGFLGKSVQTKYTFTGMPGAMIYYDDDSGFLGFDFSSEARSLKVSVQSNGNVTLIWQEPSSMISGDWYEVYYSNTRDGFFGTLGVHYDLAGPSIGFGTNTTTISGLGVIDPRARLYFMIVPFNVSGIRGSSTYSIGVWTEEYLSGYDTIGIPLKLSNYESADWYCNNIPDTVGINYYIYSGQRWGWHSTRMPEGAFDPILYMTEGYQISTSSATKFTFIGS